MSGQASQPACGALIKATRFSRGHILILLYDDVVGYHYGTSFYVRRVAENIIHPNFEICDTFKYKTDWITN